MDQWDRIESPAIDKLILDQCSMIKVPMGKCFSMRKGYFDQQIVLEQLDIHN